MTKVKLCGLTRKQDIEAVNELLPDYIGFVFFERSKRYIAPQEAAKLRESLDKRIQAVGVFVDADVDFVCDLLKNNIIDIAQLHGNESAEYVDTLKHASNKPVIQAFKINADSDFEVIEKSPADLVLLDSGAGSGKTFDWSLAGKVKRAYLLAGGLNPENVRIAIEQLKPYGVDVSGGIETDGFKDKSKMRAFVENARSII